MSAASTPGTYGALVLPIAVTREFRVDHGTRGRGLAAGGWRVLALIRSLASSFRRNRRRLLLSAAHWENPCMLAERFEAQGLGTIVEPDAV